MDKTKRAMTIRAWRKRLSIVCLILVVLSLGFGIHSYLSIRPSQIRELVRRTLVSVFPGEVRLSETFDVFWDRRVRFHHLCVTPGGTSNQQLRVRRLEIEPKFFPLLVGELVVDEILLVEPVLVLTHEKAQGAETFPFFSALESVFQRAEAGWKGAATVPRVRIQNGSIYRPPDAGGESRGAQDLVGITALLEQVDEGSFLVVGSARSPFLERLEFRGRWKVGEEALSASVRALRVNLAGEVEHLLAPQLNRMIQQLDLRGLLDLEGQLRIDANGVEIDELQGRVLDGHLHPLTIPSPLEHFSAQFQLKGRSLVLTNIDGWLGASPLTGHASLEWAPGWDQVTHFTGQLALPSLLLHSGIRSWIPEALRSQFDRLDARGDLAVEINIDSRAFPPPFEDVQLTVGLQSIEFSHQIFPYKFTGLIGELSIANGRATISRALRASGGECELTVTGWFDLVEVGKLDLEIEVQNLTLDEAFRAALPATALQYWQFFQPAGTLDLTSKVRGCGVATDGRRVEPKVNVTVNVQEGRFRYERFPLQIEEITGQAEVDLVDKKLRFSELRGLCGGRPVEASGTMDLGATGGFSIDVVCPKLTIEEDLLKVLPPSTRRFVEEFDLQGWFEADVKLRSADGGDTDTTVDLTVKDVSASFVHFPYPLRLVSGRVKCEDNRFLFEEIKTVSDGSSEATIRGELKTFGGKRDLKFSIQTHRLVVDERLEAALPRDLKRLVAGLGLRGTFSGELDGTFSYDMDSPLHTRVEYEGRNIQSDDCTVNFGTSVREIHAHGQIQGRKEFTGRHEFSGIATVDYSEFNRIHFEGVDMVFTFGQEHPTVRLARKGTEAAAADDLSEGFLKRLTAGAIGDCIQVKARSESFYDGELEGFLYIDVGEQRDFAGRFQARGAHVDQAASDVFRLESPDISGEARGRVQFNGTTGDVRSIVGEGEIQIDEAELGELPLFVGFMSLLFSFKPTTEPRFREVEIDFAIEDGQFLAMEGDDIAIRGDGVNLFGFGAMGFDGQLDVTLTPHVSDLRIPILETIFELVKKALIQIWVEGDLEDPQFRLVTGAGMLRLPFGSPKSAKEPEQKEE